MTQHLLSTQIHTSCYPTAPKQTAGRGRRDSTPELSRMLAKAAAHPSRNAHAAPSPAGLSLPAASRVRPASGGLRTPLWRARSEAPSSHAWRAFVGQGGSALPGSDRAPGLAA